MKVRFHLGQPLFGCGLRRLTKLIWIMMQTTIGTGLIFRAIIMMAVVTFAAQSKVIADEKVPSETLVQRWLDEWGEKWWERFHSDLDARYPGGRSNIFHDMYIAESMKNFPLNRNSDWNVSNRHYILDGDWFAVEWLYEATNATTGKVQRESTVAFGRIVDNQLMVWIEYFDDMVGHYQRIGAMRLFHENEHPFPWPARTVLTRQYRP